MRLASAMNASTDSAASPFRYSTDIPSSFPLVERLQQPLRRYQTIRSFQAIRHLRPVWPAVEIDPEPARRANVRRNEIPIGPLRNDNLLRHVHGLAPHRIAPRTVMIRRAGE